MSGSRAQRAERPYLAARPPRALMGCAGAFVVVGWGAAPPWTADLAEAVLTRVQTLDPYKENREQSSHFIIFWFICVISGMSLMWPPVRRETRCLRRR